MKERFTLLALANLHGNYKFPVCRADLLVCLGDIVRPAGSQQEWRKQEQLEAINPFTEWWNSIRRHFKWGGVLVPGNEDRVLYAHLSNLRGFFPDLSLRLWDRHSANIGGVQFTALAWQTVDSVGVFHESAFAYGESLKKLDGTTDVLLTHVPAYTRLDVTTLPARGKIKRNVRLHTGEIQLTEKLQHSLPLLHLHGDGHGSYGYQQDEITTTVNANLCDRQRRLVHTPILLTLERASESYKGWVCAAVERLSERS